MTGILYTVPISVFLFSYSFISNFGISPSRYYHLNSEFDYDTLPLFKGGLTFGAQGCLTRKEERVNRFPEPSLRQGPIEEFEGLAEGWVHRLSTTRTLMKCREGETEVENESRNRDRRSRRVGRGTLIDKETREKVPS